MTIDDPYIYAYAACNALYAPNSCSRYLRRASSPHDKGKIENYIVFEADIGDDSVAVLG